MTSCNEKLHEINTSQVTNADKAHKKKNVRSSIVLPDKLAHLKPDTHFYFPPQTPEQDSAPC